MKPLSEIKLKYPRRHIVIIWGATVVLLLAMTAAYVNLRSEREIIEPETVPVQAYTELAPSEIVEPAKLFPLSVDVLVAPFRPMEEMDNNPPRMVMSEPFSPPEASDQNIPELMALVREGSPQVRASAFRSLCRIPGSEARAAAIGTILSMYNENASEAMIKTFTNVDAPAVAELLVGLMIDSEDSGFKQWLQDLLVRMEGDSVTDALALTTLDYEDESLRNETLTTLAGMQMPSSLTALDDIVSTEPDMLLTQAAAHGIANIGNGRAVELLHSHASELTGGTMFSIEALAKVSSPYGQEALFTVLREEEDPSIREAVGKALGSYKGSETVVRLKRQYTVEENPVVKRTLAESIANAEPVRDFSYPPESEVSELIEMAWN